MKVSPLARGRGWMEVSPGTRGGDVGMDESVRCGLWMGRMRFSLMNEENVTFGP